MGNSKKGFPVCYFHAGKVSIDGMLCMATMEQIQKIQWHMSTSFTRKQYKKWKDRDPDAFIPRLEQITVINLEGMSKSFFSKRNMSCLKQLNVVLQSFPEVREDSSIVLDAFFRLILCRQNITTFLIFISNVTYATRCTLYFTTTLMV